MATRSRKNQQNTNVEPPALQPSSLVNHLEEEQSGTEQEVVAVGVTSEQLNSVLSNQTTARVHLDTLEPDNLRNFLKFLKENSSMPIESRNELIGQSAKKSFEITINGALIPQKKLREEDKLWQAWSNLDFVRNVETLFPQSSDKDKLRPDGEGKELLEKAISNDLPKILLLLKGSDLAPFLMALETFRRKEDFIDSEEFDDPTYQKQLIQLVLTAMKTRKDPFLVNLHRMLFKEQQNLSTMQQLYEFLIKETAAIIAMQTQILAFHGISTFTIGKEDKTMSSVTNKSDKREKKGKNGGKAPPSNLPQKQYCNYCNNLHHAKHGKVSCFYKVHRHPDINPSGQWEGSKAAEKWLKIGSDPNRPGGSHIIRGKLANGNPWDPEKPQEGELIDFSELPFHIHEKNDKI